MLAASRRVGIVSLACLLLGLSGLGVAGPLGRPGRAAALVEAADGPGEDPAPLAPADGAGLLPGLDARLVGVPLAWGPNLADVQALRRAQDRVDRLTTERAKLTTRSAEIDGRLPELDVLVQRAAARLLALDTERRSLSAVVYTRGVAASQARALAQAGSSLDLERASRFGNTVARRLRHLQKLTTETRRLLDDETARLVAERSDVGARLTAVDGVEMPEAQRDVARLRVRAATTLAAAEVDGLGIPLAAADAYLRAAAAVGEEQPGCRLTWWSLAAVGRAESNHGRMAGAQPGPGGDVTPRIVGIALDGSPGFAALPDSDHGVLDGDTEWDRAVGPMQFIPSTWRRYAADGNGDGVTSPNNLYDAALGAARLLCASGTGLDGDDGLRRAYFAYNHSDAYVDAVLDVAHRYQRDARTVLGW